jgi:hypothetical protein
MNIKSLLSKRSIRITIGFVMLIAVITLLSYGPIGLSKTWTYIAVGLFFILLVILDIYFMV